MIDMTDFPKSFISVTNNSELVIVSYYFIIIKYLFKTNFPLIENIYKIKISIKL